MAQITCQPELSSITVGQKTILKCSFDGFASAEMAFVTPEAHKYEIVFLDRPTVSAGNITQVITSYKTGNHDLKDLTFKAGDKTFPVSSFQLNVQSVLPQQQQGQGQPEPTPFPNVDPLKLAIPLWWWIIWVVVLGGIAIFSFIRIRKYLIARRKAKEEASRTEKILSPKEKFNLAMQKLESQELHSKGEYKKFALELTVILKKSIGDKFRFAAEDMTTEEFFEVLSGRQKIFWSETENVLKITFDNLDKIKFAKVETTPENCLALLDMGKQIGNVLFRGEP